MKKYLFLINLVVLLAVCQGAWAQSGSWLDDANLPANKRFQQVDTKTYYINSESELALMAYWCKHDMIQPDMVFKLNRSLDMSAHYWEPRDFRGNKNNETGEVTTIIFDGNGHTISGIYTESGQDEVGLFRLVNYATIKNVKLARSTITGSIWAGGLVSMANFGVSILNCYVGDDVIINSSGGGIAGLFGNTTNEKECSIVGCVSAATINGSESGGIVGYFHRKATLKDCLYIGSSISGNRSGAMVGDNNGDDNAITNCYYTNPSLTGTNSSYDVLAYSVSGGTDGMTVSFETPTTNYIVSGIGAFAKGMMYDGKRYGPNGDIVEFSVSSADESKIIVKVKANDTPLIPEEGNNYRLPIENTNYLITCEMATMSWEGEGTYAMPYLIRTCDEMDQLATIVNAGYAFSNKYFRLENDLDFTGRNYLPVGFSDSSPFGGTFDGQGKTISGISFSIGDQSGIDINKATIGIFGAVSGTVKNLRLAGSSIEGGKNTGGIVGTNNGTVTNCHVGSNVSISSFGQWPNIGGIVGYNIGKIEGCTSAASVSTTNDVNGYGGIVGNNDQDGTVKNCLYLGNTVSAGNSTYVGAIAGYTNYGTFSNNLYHPASDSGMKAIGGDETAYDAEGAERGYSITSGTDGLTLNFGNAYNTYDYNGIALYTNGMLFDGVFYTKGNSVVDFVANSSPGKKTRLKASSGTLVAGSGEDAYRLTMDNADVTITEVAYYLICNNNNWSQHRSYKFAWQDDGSCKLYTQFSGEFKIMDESGNELGGTGLGVGTPSVTLDPNGAKFFIDWETYYTFVIKDGVLTVSGWPHDNYIYVNRPNIVSRSIEMTKDADGNWVAKNVQINDGYWFKPAKMYGGNLKGAALYGCDGESMEIAESQLDNAIGIYPGDGYGQFMLPAGYYTMKVSADFTTLTVTRSITLENNANNASLINSNNGKKADVKLNGRTFAKNGSWFPLCLPFDVDNFDGTPLEGAVVKEFSSSSFSQGMLSLGFKGVQKIEAGKPYLVKWEEEGQSVVNPEFHAVVIKDESHPKETDVAEFVGSYDPVVLQADNRSVLYIGKNNMLYYPTAKVTLGALRGYFFLRGLEAGEPREGGTTSVNQFKLTFDDGETLAIESLDNLTTSPFDGTGAIFDLQGRKADGSKLTKGIYIVNGKKVVIK